MYIKCYNEEALKIPKEFYFYSLGFYRFLENRFYSLEIKKKRKPCKAAAALINDTIVRFYKTFLSDP